ncbi:hypothetical protein BDD14_6260 [Edaphobacter modestus]|uniref:Uncharacterized protein n=1 Tax=Edaphobacter modestus TaxID=388466 RepID=A0A4Q7XZ49_9BACT|nr:hypothetical protein BDD14_6260 [Edaphobacter modestus]
MWQDGKGGRLIRTSRVWLCGALAALVLLLVAAACVPGSRSALMKAAARSGAIRPARFEPGYGCALEGDTHSADTHYARHAQCESLIVAPADTDKRSKCDESLSAALPSGRSLAGTLADAHSAAVDRSEPLISAPAAGFRERAPPVVQLAFFW